MKNFAGLGLSPLLTESLERMQYATPTPIQAQAIPLALEGRDIMGSAQTGTGKTAAYAIPAVEALLQSDTTCVLVLTPTRELGKQVMDIMHQLLGRSSGINTAFLIGGESMGKQFAQLRRSPRLVVGTPGRINDHLERGNLKLDKTDFLVLDETDRMLDMGFSVQLDRIFKYMPAERQTLMFSATLPKNILKLSEKYLTNPERVAVGSTVNPAENIVQEVVHVQDGEKYEELVNQLDQRAGSVIIFVKTKRSADRMARNLNRDEFMADTIHGDLKQSRRDRVIKNFRAQKFRILVATDVAARGLDIPHIEHVINYDMPQVAEDYIHRIGRTARAGAKGEALCMISPTDRGKWNVIQRLMNPDFKPEKSDRNRDGDKRRRSGKKSFGKKSFGKKPFGKKSFGEKRDFTEKRDFSEKRGEGKSSGKKRFGEKKSFSKKRSSDSEGFSNDKPFGEKNRFTKKSGGKKPFGKKPFGAKKSGFKGKPKFGSAPKRRAA